MTGDRRTITILGIGFLPAQSTFRNLSTNGTFLDLHGDSNLFSDPDQVLSGRMRTRSTLSKPPPKKKFEASSGVLFGCGFGGVWRAFSLVRFEEVDFLVFSCV